MYDTSINLNGVQVPRFFYGTAWKEDATQQLVEQALNAGFRGIDTANQRKHYHEAAVGLGIAVAIALSTVKRDQLFLQTKFTHRAGQDQRLPYDPTAPIAEQVEQSFACSLEHLGVGYLDSYVLHGPSQRDGLAKADWDAWRAMESIADRGGARLLGISNVTLEQLDELCQQARVKPSFVQNRCFAALGWDYEIRQYCRARGIAYQGFSLLTANRDVLASPAVVQIARRHERTVPQIIFRFALAVGMLALTGTTSAEHMKADLEVLDVEFELSHDELSAIERAGLR